MKKIVINKCYGGFGLSEAAYKRLNKLGIPIVKYDSKNDGKNKKVIYDNKLNKEKDEFGVFERYWDSWTRENREHPLLIQVVEELKDKASGKLSVLEIVEIPDDIEYEIDDYDGIESVEEVHRSWG